MDWQRCIFCGGKLVGRFVVGNSMRCRQCGEWWVTQGSYQQVKRPLGGEVRDELKRRGIGQSQARLVEQINISRYL